MEGNYLSDLNKVEVSLEPYKEPSKFDYDAIMFQLDSQMDLLSSQADGADDIVAIASGIACSMLDIFWCGEFDLKEGRQIAGDKVDKFVMTVARICDPKHKEPKDVNAAVKTLEGLYKVPNDANKDDWGGGLQHHLRDFGHHPDIVGLIFSILTQFTKMSFGTDKNGKFKVVPIPDTSLYLIGNNVPEKIFNGTVVWFFHLVSDMAGSGNTAGFTGGTGIPGPILSLAKEFSALPIIHEIKINDIPISTFITKMFNGTLWAKRDENGKLIMDSVIRFDLRGEIGLGIELAKASVPVIANECMVRSFYFLRRLGRELSKKDIKSLEDLKSIDWEKTLPVNNPTLSEMLTISTGVFTTIDIGTAVAAKKWTMVNFVGLGRFAVAIGTDITWNLKRRDIKKLKEMYKKIEQNTYRVDENDIRREIDADAFCLNTQQTEILFNIEYCKTLYDINTTNILPNNESVRKLKKEWLNEWKDYITEGFPCFTQDPEAQITWYTRNKLLQKISDLDPAKPWFRLVLLEAMVFEPYYPLSTEKAKNGKDVPCKRYDSLKIPGNGFKQGDGDQFLDSAFTGQYCEKGYVKRLRKSYNACMNELNETLKKNLEALSVNAIIMAVTTATAGVFAPTIATALVGSGFSCLHGAALTNACLAYFGGGAIAAGGAGMAGGTATIAGGGAILGAEIGNRVGGVVGTAGVVGERNTIIQSAKLMVSLEEIYLKDEHDLDLAHKVFDRYSQKILDISQEIDQMQLNLDVNTDETKKDVQTQFNEAKKMAKAMRIARKSMFKFLASFAGTDKQAEVPKSVNKKLVVESVEHEYFDREAIIHVMKKSPDYHLHDRGALVDEAGNEYLPHLWEERECSKNRIQYAVEFQDQSLELPVGTVLYLGPESWRQPVPQCAVSEIQYTSTIAPPWSDDSEEPTFDITGQFKINIYSSGNVTIEQKATKYNKQEKEIIKLNASVTKSLIKKMLSCVTDDDSYENNYYDDTARNIKFFFEDDSMFEYNGVFFNKSTNTQEIMHVFIEKYAQILNSVIV